jgi:hypothetical protein
MIDALDRDPTGLDAAEGNVDALLKLAQSFLPGRFEEVGIVFMPLEHNFPHLGGRKLLSQQTQYRAAHLIMPLSRSGEGKPLDGGFR